ncbi:MAG: hypothetical protein U9R60_15795 [Bacteroidota bacterium]|nr:hypothetical protein [Bacteroidota bacterium]
MKKTNLFMLIVPVFFVAMIVFVASCTKEGQQGPQGESGVQTCGQCHNFSEDVLARQIQYEASGHLNGGTFERNGTDCAPCHTSMGYREVLQTGEQETSAAISNPTPVNCFTCHNIHETYTSSDWQLRSTTPVAFWINDVVSDQGTANVCISCHQPRIPDPFPSPGTREDITITSPYWGPHHGPQGTMIAGTGGYEVGGGYSNSAHSNIENTCVKCHMAEAYGNQAGGHTWNMTYLYHGGDHLNIAGCTDCHTDPDALEAMVEGTVEVIDGLLADLRTVLLTQGVLDSSDHVIPGTMSMDQAGGVFNYLFVLEDRSEGLHNTKYAKKLMENSIESLQ